MAQLQDHIEYLSREIGARPAGTEEEQQAALYIADQLQHEAGFHAEIEEFTSSSNLEGARAIPAVVIVVVVILSMLFNVLTLPALIITLIAGAIYALEAFDHPVLSRALARGASQNVVAKYQPGGDTPAGTRQARTRKVVLVAHYDTGKVKPGVLRTLEQTGLPLGLVCVGGMAATALLLLIRVFLGSVGGVATIILNVLAIVALVLVALPILKAVLYRLAPYNEGANNNASATAALIEVAKRISAGSVSEADLAANPEFVTMHGEEQFMESGLVPEGAEVHYEGDSLEGDEDLSDYSEEERLLAAKAAIAALTGRPVETQLYATHVSESGADTSQTQPAPTPVSWGQPEIEGAEPVQDDVTSPADVGQTVQAAQNEPSLSVQGATAEQSAALPDSPGKVTEAEEPGDASGFQNAPSWFVSAQRNAKKSAGEVSQSQKSRYNQAIKNAEAEAVARERARQEAQRRQRDEAARAAVMAASQSDEGGTPQAKQANVQDMHAYEPASAAQEAAQGHGADQQVPASAVEAQGAYAAPAVAEGERMPKNPVGTLQLPIELPAVQPAGQQASPDGATVQEPALDAASSDLGSTMAQPPIHLTQEEVESALASVPLDAEIDEKAAPTPNEREDSASAIVQGEDEQPAEGEQRANNPLLASLPSIGFDSEGDSQVPGPATAQENANPSRSGLFRKLRTDVPSLSGSIRMQQAGGGASQRPQPVAVAPASPQAFSPAPVSTSAVVPSVSQTADVDYDMNLADLGETTAFAPQDTTALKAPANAAVEPAAKAEEPRGAHAASPEVDMPTSRAGGFLGRLRKGSAKKLEETPQEWLDVDESFDAREVGRERGSWESFRTDDGQGNQGNQSKPDASTDAGTQRNWEGGGFSRVHLDYVDTRSGEGAESDVPEELVESSEDRILNEEIGQIMHFRNPQYNTEVWFVAIGSDTELHDGAQAFVNEHRSELRGAMVIEIESLGAGVLSVASEEGAFRIMKASSRVKRYTRPAAEATGIALDEVRIKGSDSITTTIQKAGFQAMHLFGAENGEPALKGSADDVLENVDELVLEDNVSFLMELLKQN